jgi:uncharacterized protein YukE
MGTAEESGDYDNWTWEQIETAICGGVDMNADDQLAVSKDVSDPDSLQEASTHFGNVEKSLRTVHDNLKTWSDRILGVKGEWQGAGAESFRTMMQTMLGMVDSLIDILAKPSYVTTLLDAEGDLRTAISEVQAADSEAGHAALDRISKLPVLGNVYRDDGGTRIVPVALFPDIVETMTGKMRASIKKLATAYQTHADNLHDPGDIAFPTPNGEERVLAPNGQHGRPGKIHVKSLHTLKKPVLTNITGNGLEEPKALTNLELSGLEGKLQLPADALVGTGLPPGALTTNLLSASTLTNVPTLDHLQLDQPQLDPIAHLSGTNNLLNNHAPGLTVPNLESHLTLPGTESLTTPNLSLLAQTQQPPGSGTSGLLGSPGLLSMLARASRPFREVRSGLLRGTPPPVPETVSLKTTDLVSAMPNYLTGPTATRRPNFITGKDLVSEQVLTAPTSGDAPTVPGMIGRRGTHEEEDGWTTTLVEDEDPWTSGTELSPSFLHNAD